MHYIIQISDTHLYGDKNKKINGANPYINLKNVLSEISKRKEVPGLVVVSGDISQDCTFESYQHLVNLLSRTGFKYYVLPGNHDDITIMNKVFDFEWSKGTVDYFIEFKSWFVYFIDTSLYPKDHGEITPEQLTKFENLININKNKPTLVFLHHHPVSINSTWMDKMSLINPERFNSIIKNNPQIKAVLFGHIHQVFEKKIDSTMYASAPATCYQVLPNTDMFTVERITPGYRVIRLNDNEFSSQVIWL